MLGQRFELTAVLTLAHLAEGLRYALRVVERRFKLRQCSFAVVALGEEDCGGFARSAVARERRAHLHKLQQRTLSAVQGVLDGLAEILRHRGVLRGVCVPHLLAGVHGSADGDFRVFLTRACQGRDVSRASFSVARRVATGARSTSRRAVPESVTPPTLALGCATHAPSLRCFSRYSIFKQPSVFGRFYSNV